MSRINRRNSNHAVDTLFEIFALITAWHGTVYLRLFLNPYLAVQFDRVQLEQHAPPLAAIILGGRSAGGAIFRLRKMMNIRNCSLSLDFRVLLHPPLVVLAGRGAY